MPPVATPRNDEKPATDDTDSHGENNRCESVKSVAYFGGDL